MIVQDDGAGGLSSTGLLTIDVQDINEPITNLTLSTNSINENNSVGDVIGTLNATNQLITAFIINIQMYKLTA